MNPRTTGVLLLLALALGAFVYFYELGGESARQEAEEREKRLFTGFEPEDVDWIALRTSDGAEARFEHRDGEWQLTEPIAFPADSAVERMADALATAVHEDVYENSQPDAEYGLDDASARIVRFAVDDREYELRLGKQTPVGSNVYAKTSESPSVQTIEGFRAKIFEHSLADLRRKQILSFDTTTVKTLAASWPDGRVSLARAGEGDDVSWHMTVPVAAKADDEEVDRLLSTLSYLRAEGFVDAPSEAQRALLAPPAFSVSLNTEAEGTPGESLTLALSRPDAEGHRLVRAGDGPVLFEIAADRIDDFPREAAAYRDRTLARFALADAQQVDFFFQSRDGDPLAIHARHTDGGWSSEPEEFAAGTLPEVVAELSHLQAQDVLAESMGEAELEKLGLSPPQTTITVLGAEPEPGAEGNQLPPPAPRLAEVYFGKETPEGVPARAADSPVVYRVGLDAAERVPVGLAAFRNRFRLQPEAEAKVPPEGDAKADLVDPMEESP